MFTISDNVEDQKRRTVMAKNGAERQAAYRAKKLLNETVDGYELAQLAVFIPKTHRFLLNQAAVRYGVTQGVMLAKMIETSRIVRKMERERDEFLAGRFSAVS